MLFSFFHEKLNTYTVIQYINSMLMMRSRILWGDSILMNELKQKTETRIFPTVEHLTGGKVEKACRVFVWISALISGLWAGLFPNFIDDAFISLRYSQNLAMGEGLVWNSGQYLEGFTNFLWTLILYLPFTLHIDPLIFIRILGGILQVGLVFMSARLARKLIGDHLAVCLVALLVAVHPSLLVFATWVL